MTITTVGYGDITGNTIPEIIFQMFLLIIGTFAYSFIISFFSNYIIKVNQKSMNYEKKLNLLNEIKLHNPNMKDSIYDEILRNIHNEQLYEKKDKQLLFHCLPYSLKNKLIMEMHRPIIKNFDFFKDVHNSDFIVKVATSLKPIILIRGDTIIKEGDFIKEIIFVKKGVIGLNICMDLNNPEISIQKYFNLMNNKNNNNLNGPLIAKTDKEKFDDKLEPEQKIEIQEEKTNFEDILIIEIKKNEHFGDALMFLNERSPLSVKVKTKTAELLVLKKMEAIEIYSTYPNIWKRINKKSLFKMEKINLKAKKSLINLSKKYKVKIPRKVTKKFKLKKSALQSSKIKEKKDFMKINENKESKNNDNDEQKEKQNNSEKSEEMNNNFDNQKENQNNSNLKEDKEENNEIIMNTNNLLGCKKNKEDIEVMSFKKYSIGITTPSNKNFSILKEKESQEINCIDETKNDLNKTTINKLFSNGNNNNSYLSKPYIMEKLCNSDMNIFEQNNSSKSGVSAKIYDNKNYLNNSKNASVFPNNTSLLKDESMIKENISNAANNSNDLNNFIDKKLSIKTNKEKIYYNAFINLSSTKENSFLINSSYENINKFSNNKYINDITLRKKTKQFIINECRKGDLFPIKKELKKYSESIPNFPKIKINYEKKIIPNSNSNDNLLSQNIYKKNMINTSYYENAVSKTGNSDLSFSKNNNSGKSSPTNSFPKKLNKKSSMKLYRKLRMSPIYSAKLKRRPKKKASLIELKLSAMNKNIQNANDAINRPEEFYKNLFTKILRKDSFMLDQVGEKTKK